MGGEYTGRRVAVTGGTGFIGSRLAERLALEEGADVKVLVRDWRKATWVSRADVTLVEGDVTKPDTLASLMDKVEIAFHCAVTGGPLEQCRRVNVEGTKNVLNACVLAGVRRIIYFSTIGVHGPFLTEGLDESVRFRRLGTPYADSKIESEELFWEFLKHHDLEGVVIRPTYVWGPKSPRFTVTPIRKMIEGRFTLVDKGEGACNAVYIDNVVDLAILSGSHPRAAGKAFLVRDQDRLRWRVFFGYYADMAGMYIDDFPSVKSGASFNRGTGLTSRVLLIRARDLLRRGMRTCTARFPALVRYGRKAPNSPIRLVRSAADSSFPDPYSWWDLKLLNSPGFISIDKAKLVLGFTPRFTVPEGMRDCEVWLRDQCHLPTRSDIFTSSTQQS